MIASRTLRLARTLRAGAVSAPSSSSAPSHPPLPRLKTTTEITGLEVHPDPLPELMATYAKTLSVLSSLPQSAVYRQATEAIVRHRASILERAQASIEKASEAQAHEDAITSVEQGIDAGQIEEVLAQARDELSLASNMVEWKSHEPLEHAAPDGQWVYFSMAEEAGEGGNHV